jgi:N-acetylglutamate synthase-like GNAT family acetyltransferase
MEFAYEGYQERIGRIRLQPMDLDYMSEIKDYRIWVVETENDIVGGLTTMFKNNQASITNIAVSPATQG